MQTSKLLEHKAALCNIIRRIALEAGDKTLEYFDEAGFADATRKEDGTLVTKADQEAEEIIEKALLDLTPDIPIVGEEATAGGHIADLNSSDYLWLVDPLDGTREFISGSGDYTVNIALIYKGEPILGVVYAPVNGELYAGYEGGAAIRWSAETDKEKQISVRPPPKEGLTVVASRGHGNNDKLEKFLADFKVEKVIRRGSSLKICAVAAGKADLYPRFGPTCEWDTAAGDAVLRAAGGKITDINGKPLVYGDGKPGFLNPEFIAWGGDL